MSKKCTNIYINGSINNFLKNNNDKYYNREKDILNEREKYLNEYTRAWPSGAHKYRIPRSPSFNPIFNLVNKSPAI